MSFKVEVERITLIMSLLCEAKRECNEHADFTISDVPACREHIWLVLMHEHRKDIGARCGSRIGPPRCIPVCDNRAHA